MKLFNSKKKLTQKISQLKEDNFTIGFVPTMGALHDGHLSLACKALQENDYLVVSIFVNPTQFNNQEDLSKYPRTLKKDIDLLNTVSSNNLIVYAPSEKDVYGIEVVSDTFSFDGLDLEMEGKFRPGHFNGVGTVVKRLLNIVQPHKAYFGEKDYQQLMIIKNMVRRFHIPVDIIGCKILRETSGLAMSSRNERLKPEFRKAAPFIYKTLKSAKTLFKTKSATKVTKWVTKQFKEHALLKLEYFNIMDIETLKSVKRKSSKKSYRAFIAVYADDIRLIDNIALN